MNGSNMQAVILVKEGFCSLGGKAYRNTALILFWQIRAWNPA